MAGFDIKAAVAQAAKEGPDMREAKSGGGYEPPAEGRARARFIGYVELGKQKHEWKGQVSYKDKVKLIFELSGPKWQPRVTDDGTKIPHRITIEENLVLSERAHFYKVFRAMNHDKSATHMAELLGGSFLIDIKHHPTSDGKGISSYKLAKGDDGNYRISPPVYEDPETGEQRVIEADPVISELRCFLWDYPSKEMWDSLYIEGEYEAIKDEKTGEITKPARSKNVFQEQIQKAQNFPGSPMEEILSAGGEVDVAEAKDEPDPKAKTGAAADDDPLAGVS